MIYPKRNKIYEYNGVKYIVLAQELFGLVYVQEYLTPENNKIGGSKFQIFNWWSFVFHAKYIDTIKNNNVY